MGRLKSRQVLESFIYCMSLSWKASRLYTVIQFFSRIFSVMIPIAVTWVTKEILDLLAVSDGSSNKKALVSFIIVLLLLYLMRLAINQAGTYASAMQQDILLHYIEREMAETALKMDLEYFDNPAYYDAFEAVKRDIFSVLSVVYDGITVISYGISSLGCIAILITVTPIYTVLILAASVPVAVSNHGYTKKLYLWGLDHVKEERQMQYLYQTVTGRSYAQNIRLYGIGPYLLEKYQGLWDQYFSEKQKVARIRALWNLLLSVFPELLSAVALGHIGFGILAGQRTFGDFTLYSGLLVQLTGGLYALIQSSMELYEKKLKIHHFNKFLTMVYTNKKEGTRELSPPVEIEFRNVSFCYPGTDRFVLRNISFRLPQGKKICIVGENGAGKTTILKLLLNFYDPQEGKVLINGIPVQEYTSSSLRSAFSCFFQKDTNFAFTLRENIRISRIGYDEKTAKERQNKALQMSGAASVAEKLKYGDKTYLSRAYEKDGIELSGGQNQKIALARMFYRDAPVLVLDEPTADLDPRGEHELFQTLQKECRSKSLLFVSHRLSNVFLADEIIVMESGKISAQGTHETLLENCELYRKLFHYQSDKYRLRIQEETKEVEH